MVNAVETVLLVAFVAGDVIFVVGCIVVDDELEEINRI